MFDLGWSEMFVVGAVALVVIGPKDLPGALRQAGKWMGSVRRMASDFQGHVNQAMREAELDELRREVSNLKTGFSDPVAKTGAEMKSLVEKPAALPPSAPAPAAKPRAGAKPNAKATPKAVAKAAPKPQPGAKPKKPAGKKT